MGIHPDSFRIGIIKPLRADRASNSWHTVEFSAPFPPPFLDIVVIPMTQTYNGPEIPGLRIQNVTGEGFQIRFDEALILKNNKQYASDGSHVDEVVGWVAYAIRG